MCAGCEIGKGLVACLACKKPVDPLDEWEGDAMCHCDGPKVRYEGKGQFTPWERPA